MNAYIYASDIYCKDCGEDLRADLDAAGRAPADVADESSYDSDDYPKGPYPDGGGEADTPQVCAACGVLLLNPLTPQGYAAVRAEVDAGSLIVPASTSAIYAEQVASHLEAQAQALIRRAALARAYGETWDAVNGGPILSDGRRLVDASDPGCGSDGDLARTLQRINGEHGRGMVTDFDTPDADGRGEVRFKITSGATQTAVYSLTSDARGYVVRFRGRRRRLHLGALRR